MPRLPTPVWLGAAGFAAASALMAPANPLAMPGQAGVAGSRPAVSTAAGR